MSWKKEVTKMCIAFANAEDQSLTSEERKRHHEEYLHVRTNLLRELEVQLLRAHFWEPRRSEMSKPDDGYHSNEEWARDAYERRDFENLADKLERFAKGKHIPKTLRKNMFATAWDMKQYARRGTASFGV